MENSRKTQLYKNIKIDNLHTPKVGGNYMAGFEFVIDSIASQDHFGTICNGHH